jgi:hypothetical protein
VGQPAIIDPQSLGLFSSTSSSYSCRLNPSLYQVSLGSYIATITPPPLVHYHGHNLHQSRISYDNSQSPTPTVSCVIMILFSLGRLWDANSPCPSSRLAVRVPRFLSFYNVSSYLTPLAPHVVRLRLRNWVITPPVFIIRLHSLSGLTPSTPFYATHSLRSCHV